MYPKTGVPQKLWSHINGNILKQTFFNDKNIFFSLYTDSEHYEKILNEKNSDWLFLIGY